MLVSNPPSARLRARHAAERSAGVMALAFLGRGMSTFAPHDDLDFTGFAVGVEMLDEQHDDGLVSGARLVEDDIVRGRDGEEVGHDWLRLVVPSRRAALELSGAVIITGRGLKPLLRKILGPLLSRDAGDLDIGRLCAASGKGAASFASAGPAFRDNHQKPCDALAAAISKIGSGGGGGLDGVGGGVHGGVSVWCKITIRRDDYVVNQNMRRDKNYFGRA